MKGLSCVVLLSTLLAVSAAAQRQPGTKASPLPQSPKLRSFTLTGPYAEDGHGKLKHSDKIDRNCFDFVSDSEVACRGRWDIVYGSMRAGEEWDWFYVPAAGAARTRMKSLGKKDWTEIKSMPEIDALPKLKPGEKRVASVDASGADGADGAAGHDGAPGTDGVSGDGSVSEPVTREVERRPTATPSKPKRSGQVATNEHFIKAVKGNMYVLRVVDDEHDFYVLIRVDDIVRGRTATISWLKLVDM